MGFPETNTRSPVPLSVRVAAGLVLVAGLAPASPPAQGGPGWERGFERLSYGVSWGYLEVGRAIFQARRPGPGRVELLTESCVNGPLGHLYEGSDRLLAHSRFNGGAWHTEAFRAGGGRGAEREARQYRFAASGVVYIRDLVSGNTDYRAVPEGTLDVLTALYAIRSRPLEPGAGFTLPVLERGRPFRLHGAVTAGEPLDTVLGDDTATLRVDTYLKEAGSERRHRPLEVWFTADRRHLPVRLVADGPLGGITLDLRAVQTTRPSDPETGLACR